MKPALWSSAILAALSPVITPVFFISVLVGTLDAPGARLGGGLTRFRMFGRSQSRHLAGSWVEKMK
jgi:hypothetical protein